VAHAIALLLGDGIGQEVVAEARRVLERVQAL
jgi:isocitrate/isopropylmalate dehydrogenase